MINLQKKRSLFMLFTEQFRFSRIFLFSLTFSMIAAPALAYVASSTNYRLQEDSVNTAGNRSTSTSYRLEDSIGQGSSGTSSGATYRVNAGYQQMYGSTLSLSVPGNLSLSPTISTTGGGTANASGVWTVGTDNPAGFTMTISAVTSPALTSGVNNFANYVPGGVPDMSFAAPIASHFGYTPEGLDIAARFRDNGAVCNAGAGDTVDTCWDGLSLVATEIARRVSPTPPGGSLTTVKFRAASAVANVQAAGSYSAPVVLTVLPL